MCIFVSLIRESILIQRGFVEIFFENVQIARLRLQKLFETVRFSNWKELLILRSSAILPDEIWN